MFRTVGRVSPIFVTSVALFWIGFTALVVAIGWASFVLRDRAFNASSTLLWNAGWLLWVGETFVVMTIARALPIERARLGQRIASHVCIGFLVALVHVSFESVLIGGLATAFGIENAVDMGFQALFFYKFHIFYLVYWTVVGATSAYDYYARFRETETKSARLATELVEWQLQALKSQLHPHFLFNAHHSIIALMLKGDGATAVRMLTKLSELLRLTLDQPNRQTAPLSDELAALRLYIAVQAERFGDRLQFAIKAPDELLACEVPYLILQPLVENAITHGIDPNAEGGEIVIEASRDEGFLQLSVTDPGCEKNVSPIARERHGVGLENTRTRLQRLYGERGRFELRQQTKGGTKAEIRFPIKKEREPSIEKG